MTKEYIAYQGEQPFGDHSWSKPCQRVKKEANMIDFMTALRLAAEELNVKLQDIKRIPGIRTRLFTDTFLDAWPTPDEREKLEVFLGDFLNQQVYDSRKKNKEMMKDIQFDKFFADCGLTEKELDKKLGYHTTRVKYILLHPESFNLRDKKLIESNFSVDWQDYLVEGSKFKHKYYIRERLAFEKENGKWKMVRHVKKIRGERPKQVGNGLVMFSEKN